MKILIAEDDSALQRIAGKLMKRWGFDFDVASNGREAVDRAKANVGKYDLCLMDIDMPIMNGCEATIAIRQTLDFFPILGLSGNLEAMHNYRKLGMDGFLEKPYGIDNLYKKIKELTVKVLRISREQNTLALRKETPMNKEELQELIQLKKKGLTKLKLVGTDYTFVVHKNIQNKISHDLVGEGKELSEFIDRSETEPGRCHLYKVNLHITKDLFTLEELEGAIQEENEIAVKFTRATDKKLQNEKA